MESLENVENIKQAINFENFRLAPRFDATARNVLIRPNVRLAKAHENSTAKGLPPISVVPMAGQHLSILTQLIRAKSVLEVGTLGGYSAICLAEAGAKVTSVEIDPKHRDVALENTKGLDVEIILGGGLDVLPRLEKEGRQFDMVFIDADFDGQWEMFDWAVKLTRPGGCVFLDDVVVAMIKDGETEEGTESILTKIGRDDRVKAALNLVALCHPMIDTPVFNGYILALVKAR